MKKKNGPNHSVITAYQNAPSLYRNNCEDKRKGLCPNGLSQSFEGQKSKMALNGLKSRCQQDCTPSGGSKGKKFFFFLFQFLEVPCVPWLMASSYPFKAHLGRLSLSHTRSPRLAFTVTFPSFFHF